MINVFTDGSSIKNGKVDCISGCSSYFEDREYSLSSKDAGILCDVEIDIESNNVGELMGILVALCVTDKNEELMIYSDSMYCINSITVWSEGWAKKDWITSGGTPVKNKKIIQKILDEKSKFKRVCFKHVKGHKKEPLDKDSEEWYMWNGNDKADHLAFYSIRDSSTKKT